MGASGTSVVRASGGESLWTLWDHNAKQRGVSWEQFQADFRKANTNFPQDRQLNENSTYNVPTYDDPEPAPPPSAGPDKREPTGLGPEMPLPTGPAPGSVIPAGQADGSSPANAIKVAPGQVLDAVSPSQLADAVGADAFVVAVKGSVGVQDIPGWDKIPGLKNLGKDAKIDYLAATLTPFSVGLDSSGGVSVTAKPLDTTLFLSLKLPNVDKPVIVTTKISDLNFEGGTPIENRVVKGGQVIFFSNFRAGVTANEPGTTGDNKIVTSVNGGILVRSDNLKRTVKGVTDLVHKAVRSVQAGQAVAAAAAAPESGGGSLAAGAASIAGTEVTRGAILKSLDKADWYVGLAWRGEVGTGNAADGSMTVQGQKGGIQGIVNTQDGSVTIKAQNGPFRDKWITFNLTDVPGSFFDDAAPDFSAPDKEWLITQGATPETAQTMSESWRNDGSMQPLINDMAKNLGVDTPTLVQWFNKLDKDDLEHYVTYDMSRVPQNDDGTFSQEPSMWGNEWPPMSTPDVITLADVRERYPRLPGRG